MRWNKHNRRRSCVRVMWRYTLCFALALAGFGVRWASAQGNGYNAARNVTVTLSQVVLPFIDTTLQQNSLILYHELIWTPNASVATCSVRIDSSVDGVTWTTGGIITAQNCATAGNTGVPGSSVQANYIRIVVSTLTGTGASVILQYEGWAYAPGGGGSTGVTSLNTLTGAITLAAGTNITLTTSGNTITIAASGGGSGCSVSGTSGQLVYNNGSSGCSSSATTITSGGSITLPSTQVLSWNGDTGISRGAAGVVDIGTGTQGSNAGTLNAATENITGTATIGTVTATNFKFGTGATATAIQGTDTSLLSSGTISGTGASLCTDANGGATTTGCSGGGGDTITSPNSTLTVGGTTTNTTIDINLANPNTWTGAQTLTNLSATGIVSFSSSATISPSLVVGNQNVTGGVINVKGGSSGLGGQIGLFGTGASPGSFPIQAQASGTTLDVGSGSMTVTTAGAITMAGAVNSGTESATNYTATCTSGGSTSAPCYLSGQATNTGIAFFGSNAIDLIAAGTERARVVSTGMTLGTNNLAFGTGFGTNDTVLCRQAANVFELSTSASTCNNSASLQASNYYVASTLLISGTAPTISSGFGTSPSVVNNNGTAAFTINVGTGGTATSGVIGLPTASHGWHVDCTDITNSNATVFVTKQTATTTTTATVGNFTNGGNAGAWTASDVLSCSAQGY